MLVTQDSKRTRGLHGFCLTAGAKFRHRNAALDRCRDSSSRPLRNQFLVMELDALDGDAQAQPPDGQLGEVEHGVGAGEGDAVVGADGGRQAALEEELLEGGDGGVFAG